jgi:hypothetical protein
MESALLDMPPRIDEPFEVHTLGALDTTSSDASSAIKRADADLIRKMTDTLDKQLLGVLSCRTQQELIETRERVWSKYFRARRALSDTIDLVVPKNVIQLVRFATAEKISEDLVRYRGVLFAEQVAEQVEFTDWLLTKMQFLGRTVAKAGEPRDRNADSKLHEDFLLCTSWGQFHYDCVLASMKFELPIPEQIQGSIRDGLRAWVNATSIMEEALALRVEDGSERLPEFFDGPWDKEDQELLESSMKDLDAECSSAAL